MMKTTTKGKYQHSKRSVLEFDSFDEFNEYFREHGCPNDKGELTFGYSFQERVSSIVKDAEKILKAEKLPYTPEVYKTGRKTWSMKQPPEDKFQGRRTLEYHIVTELDDEKHDSIEALAAGIITAANRMENRTGEHKLEQAFKLGHLVTLANVNWRASSKGKKAAESPRRKDWAIALAKELVTDYKNFPEAWESIPDDGKIYAEFLVWREGDYLQASSASQKRDDSLKKGSFRVGYFNKERNK